MKFIFFTCTFIFFTFIDEYKVKDEVNSGIINNDLLLCNETLHINNLVLDLCSNSGMPLSENQFTSGVGSSFVKTFQNLDETSFEDTGGKELSLEYSQIGGDTNDTIFLSVFFNENEDYFYSFHIESDKVVFKYNSGSGIKIGDHISQVGPHFSSKGFSFNTQKKSATIHIINESYLTFHFDDNLKLKSIEFNYILV